MVTPVSFVFNGYENNPIVKMCLEKQPRHILTEKDLLPIIQKLRHSKWAWDNKQWNFVGDELRLYLASQSDDFLYIDADAIIENPEDIKMDHCPANFNNGTFFRANKDTAWVKYYLDVYENNDIGQQTNMRVFQRYPYVIPTQDNILYRHYFTSFWERWHNRNKSIKHELLFDATDEQGVRTLLFSKLNVWHYYKDCETFARECLI